MQMSAAHPFNLLALLRLAIACGPNRYVCETIFRDVWRGGAEAADPARVQALQQELAPPRDPNSDEFKNALKQATAEAIAGGLFGVPSLQVDHEPGAGRRRIRTRLVH
jgi:2-hydroxychromene-2-carboxylate isomerase